MFHQQKLSSTGNVASRVKNLFSGSPVSKRKRTMSLDALSTHHGRLTFINRVNGGSILSMLHTKYG